MRVLFTSTLETPFIREDLNLLRTHFEVRPLTTRGLRSALRIPHAVAAADATVTWFASVYSFLVVFCARALRKPSVIIVGGADAAREREIGYGIWLVRWKAILVRWAVRHASRVCAVDPSLVKNLTQLARYGGSNIRVVPTGFDAARWFPAGPKEPFVLTVAACADHVRAKVKGIDLLLETARRLGSTRFVLIGCAPPLLGEIRSQAPPNLEILPYLTPAELRPYYQRAAVYCQPSRFEGLPNSLCEAMLCGCVPVGTDVGGIPTAVGEWGFLVPPGDPGRLAEGVEAALRAPPSLGGRARSRIAEAFPLSRRESALVTMLGDLVR